MASDSSNKCTLKFPERLREDFDRDGFVIVPGLLPPSALEAVCTDLQQLTQRVAEKCGLSCEDSSLERAVAELDAAHAGFGAKLHEEMALTDAVVELWRHPSLLEMVHALSGWEAIAAHPIFNIRPKTPSARELNYGMHQDPAFWGKEAASIGVVACWLPLVPVSSLNGTLQVIRGSQLSEKVYQHFLSPDGALAPFIPEECLPPGERVVAELSPGDALFFSQLTVHGGCGPNRSDSVRWAVDLRWQSHAEANFLTGRCDTVKLWDMTMGPMEVDAVNWSATWARQEKQRKTERAWERDWTRYARGAKRSSSVLE